MLLTHSVPSLCLPARAACLHRRWIAVPESDWPGEQAQRGVIMADFDLAPGGGYGDRRQVRMLTLTPTFTLTLALNKLFALNGRIAQ